MTNSEIAAVFEQIADLLEFQDANPFRVRAYRNAARTIADTPEQMADLLNVPDRKLSDLPGIGADLAEKIATLVRTGNLPMLDELLAEVPESVLELLRIPGLGPKRAAALHKELGVKTLQELREACEKHLVRELKGFGAKTEEAILKGMDIASEAGRRVLWYEADQYARAIVAYLDKTRSIEQVEVAGSYRRGKETVGDLDILAVANDPVKAMDDFARFEGLADVLARGETKMSVRLTSGLQVDLRVVPAESFGAALQYFTGSQAHNIVLRGLAKDRGLKINEYGVFRGEKRIAGRTEEEVYATLDLPCFPPEMREARHEFEWAAAGKLPDLVELDEIRGDLHMHSTWTDGTASIEDMATAAKNRGYKYIAITDHSKRVAMVNGLDVKRIRQQWAEIDALNRQLKGFQVLKGVEVDILEQGGLDLPDDVLAEADWVVASVHYGQSQSRQQITGRVIGALQNTYVCAIAHPTGRMLLQRKPYEIDLDAVMRAAREQGKFLELNSHPIRLDLDDVACSAAKAMGVKIVISTDAHRPDGLEAMRYGVQQARRGGLTKGDVANTRSWTELKRLIGNSPKASAPPKTARSSKAKRE